MYLLLQTPFDMNVQDILSGSPFNLRTSNKMPLTMVMREGILCEGQQTDIFCPSPTCTTNLKGNS